MSPQKCSKKKNPAIQAQLRSHKHILLQGQIQHRYKLEQLPLATAAVGQLPTFFLQEELFIVFPRTEEKLYLLRSLQS